MNLQIITNNQYRPTILWQDLTNKEKENFDYLKTDDEQSQATFVRYKGCVYNTGEFMRIDNGPDNSPDLKKWDGYSSDTYFSGILLKYDINDMDYVKMGLYYS